MKKLLIFILILTVGFSFSQSIYPIDPVGEKGIFPAPPELMWNMSVNDFSQKFISGPYWKAWKLDKENATVIVRVYDNYKMFYYIFSSSNKGGRLSLIGNIDLDGEKRIHFYKWNSQSWIPNSSSVTGVYTEEGSIVYWNDLTQSNNQYTFISIFEDEFLEKNNPGIRGLREFVFQFFMKAFSLKPMDETKKIIKDIDSIFEW